MEVSLIGRADLGSYSDPGQWFRDYRYIFRQHGDNSTDNTTGPDCFTLGDGGSPSLSGARHPLAANTYGNGHPDPTAIVAHSSAG